MWICAQLRKSNVFFPRSEIMGFEMLICEIMGFEMLISAEARAENNYPACGITIFEILCSAEAPSWSAQPNEKHHKLKNNSK